MSWILDVTDTASFGDLHNFRVAVCFATVDRSGDGVLRRSGCFRHSADMDLAVSSRSTEQVNALAAQQFDDSQLVQVRDERSD